MLSSEDHIDLVARAIAPDRAQLSVRLASALIRAWREAEGESSLVVWLMRQGFEDLKLTRRISAILGPDAVRRLQQNPYCLVPLLPWAKVDELALRIFAESGVVTPRDDPRRLVGAVDACVKQVIRDGDTAVTQERLRALIARRLNVAGSSPRVQRAIEAGARNGAVIAYNGGWRCPGCAAMEDYVAARLLEMRNSPPAAGILVPPLTDLNQILDEMQQDSEPLHPEQRRAVAKSLGRSLACLQGGAGVGKTYTTRMICDVWEKLGGNVLLCALAGKAALRVSRATRRLARTLARTLGELDERERVSVRFMETNRDPKEIESEERRRLQQECKGLAEIDSETLVIVDEASMVDLATMYQLLRRMPPGARLLLVGDEHQLPPVGFGLIFHRLVADPTITERLNVVHRQTSASGIPAVAAAIRDRVLPEFAPYIGVGQGVSFIEAEDELTSVVERVAIELGGFDNGSLLIVTATNEGDAGIHELNCRFHNRHVVGSGFSEVKGQLGNWFSTGDPVVHLRNNYRLGLFNGSLGHVLNTSEDRREITARFDKEEIVFGAADWPVSDASNSMGALMDLALAYSITCHKAQGSQAERIIVPVYETKLLDPAWLYTSVTRAEQQVVIIGSRNALQAALARPWASERRHVGFRWVS